MSTTFADCNTLFCLTLCLMPILANAAQTGAQASSAYCVNPHADFYPYRASLAKAGHQLGLGNCRKTDERMVAAPIEQCVVIAGTSELPFEPAAAAAPPADRTPARGQRRERQKATRMIAAAAEAGGIQGHLLIPLQR